MKLIEKTYFEILEEQALAHPEREAVVMGSVRITYREFVDKIDQTARLLLERGLKKGDRALLWSNASVEWLYTYYGIIHAGGVAVVLNANLPTADAVSRSDFSEASFLLYGSSHDVSGLKEEAEKLADTFHMNPDHVIGISNMETPACTTVHFPERNVQDDAYIIYTSGTTSFPKAVVTAQFGIINAVHNIVGAIQAAKGERCVMAVPLFHAYGLMVSWVYLSTGGTLLIPTRIKADTVAELIEKENATDLWSVAVIYQGLTDDELLAEKVSRRIHLCTIAGSYTTPVQFMRFESTLKGTVFLNMYGMTETCAAYCLTRPEDNIRTRYTTLGRPIDGVEMKIWSEEKGFLPPGEIGEIITRGYNLKKRYDKLPPEKQAVDSDGWLHSGDLGLIDENGNLSMAGRIKDIIIKGGENIVPSEIENEVLTCDGVKECRIFGFNDRIYGENLGACITVYSKEEFNEEEVRRHIKKKLGTYKIPAYFLIFDEFPLNANGKTDQTKLHMQMLFRLRKMKLAGELEKGFEIINMTFRNGTYCISAVAALFGTLSSNFGFGARIVRMRLVEEELLTMRVNEQNKNLEKINVKVILYRDHLSIINTDAGMQSGTEKTEGEILEISMKIVSHLVDDFEMEQLPDGHYRSTASFVYEQDFNIQDFLMQHEGF